MVEVVALLEGIGGPELLLVGVLALLMFGSKRLPELGRAFGRALREFKRATSGVEENLREAMRDEPRTPVIRPPVKQGPPRKTAGTSAASPAQDAKETPPAPAAEPKSVDSPPGTEPSGVA